jgi:indole-3-glycerol phosphate synthase
MLSVPCDRRFLHGSWDLFAAVRERLDAEGLAVPVLARDFVVDAEQVAWARDAGADAVLLTAGLVSVAKLKELATAAQLSELEPVFEVVDDAELDAALACDARVIGVNARELESLPDPARAARVLARIPASVVAVHLTESSGLDELLDVSRAPVHAARVADPLLAIDDAGAALRSIAQSLADARDVKRPP